ncbi:MAG: metallopeptidase family protein [Chloroflexi bacterium]|nr:metallopeptidase family protein [Chloroflexota bacterium]
MVAAAVDALPAEFRDRLSNLEFGVGEWARPEDYARTGTAPDGVLLGVYRGIPLPKRHAGYNMALPDRIVVFQGPLQRMAHDADDLAERVRHVVRHEIAHHFGISDDRLREIDAY